MCFTNWTGMVVGVKRAQVKRDLLGWVGGGGCREGAGRGSVGFRGAAVPHFKEGLQSGQTLNPLTSRCKTTHSTFTHSGSHEMNIHPLSHCSPPVSLLHPSLPARWTSVESCVHREILTKHLERFNYMLLLWYMVFLSDCFHLHARTHTCAGTQAQMHVHSDQLNRYSWHRPRDGAYIFN